ncbi:hypothetical protein VKT23_008515 [Stygiomarasmius scandens]|uniref:Cyanovirin-N domain-containing protein n=1 Tax=Marasmiellus scandens TaxID=2682957 RepID=A0ABR1JJY2_9AGAR
MPFDSTIRNAKLLNQFLVADYYDSNGDTSQVTLNLDVHLGIVDGKFEWGGRHFYSSAQKLSLDGSILSAELKNINGQWTPAKIDLGGRVKVKNGKLAAFDANDPVGAHGNSTTKSSYKKFRTSSSETSRSSSFFKYSVAAEKLRLVGSVLHAECRRADGSVASSSIDLDQYIGVIDNKLVWGRSGFSAACKKIKLEGYTLVAEFGTERDTLDLTRYLQTYDGILGMKVGEANQQFADFFSQASWMKLRIVSEPDPSVVVKNQGLKSTFSSLAQATSKHVIAEMTEELEDSMTEEIRSTLGDKVKAEMTTIVGEAMGKEVRDDLEKKIDTAFALAKKTVIDTCNRVIDEAVNNVTIRCTESIIGPLTDNVVEKCNSYIHEAVKAVTESAIEHFQERVEILMEREIASANLRRAHTQAAFLKLMEAQAQGYF